ncbi:partial Serine/threonine-protein kinase PknD, partial [Planctomycetaceae bacterium]
VRQFTLDVFLPPFTITTATLADGVDTAPYIATITATGGTGSNYNWSVVSGALPPGLSLGAGGTPSTSLQGTPTAAGNFLFTVEAADSASNTDQQALNLTIHPAAQITTTSLPTGTTNFSYSSPITASGGMGSYAWSVTSGTVPPGLIMPSTGTPSALFAGVPNTPGTFNFTVRVDEPGGSFATQAYSVLIVSPISISPVTLPGATTTLAYGATITGSGGSALGYTWDILSGALPPGLTLAASGTPSTSLSGVPNQAGNYQFTVRVTDSIGGQGTRIYSLNVAALIRTVAGNGSFQTGSQLWEPQACACDSAGNVYVADTRNGYIRRWDATTQAITIVAGTGTFAQSPDGAVAATSPIGNVCGLAVDSSGNIYFTEESWHVVRRISASTGQLSTVAGNGSPGASGDGGPATSAMLKNPSGLAIDSAGDLYIADTQNHKIRKVSAGVITTLAGIGTMGSGGDGGPATSASLNQPNGVCIGTGGNIFIADTQNSRVRRVNAGNIYVYAGSGAYGFSGDGGLAVSANMAEPRSITMHPGGDLILCDSENHRVRRVSSSTQNITTIAGIGVGWASGGFSGDGGPATSAEFWGTYGVACDAAGNVFVVDHLNGRVRRVDASTTNISTIVGGSGSIGDGGPPVSSVVAWPQGFTSDSAGTLLVASDNRIRRVDIAGNVISTIAGDGIAGFAGDNGPATSAQLNNSRGLARDAAGNIYIADSYNHRVRRIDAGTGEITTVAGSGPTGYGTGAFSGDGAAATLARLNEPSGVAVDAAGNLYIADSNNHRIRRVDAVTGFITTIAGSGATGASQGSYSGDGGAATSATLNYPQDVCLFTLGPQPALLIADTFNHRIRFLNLTSGVIVRWAGSGSRGSSGDGGSALAASFSSPRALAVSSSGLVYVADTDNARVRRFSGQGGTITTVAGGGSTLGDGGPATSAKLSDPHGVFITPSGNVFIADRGQHRVRELVAP